MSPAHSTVQFCHPPLVKLVDIMYMCAVELIRAENNILG